MAKRHTNNSVFFSFLLLSLLVLAGFLVAQQTDFMSFAPGLAHAQTLHTDLTPPGSPDSAWMFGVWRTFLGLGNALVAIALLFFAVVNIAHIQYDTYQLKKTLPKLIIGIILANFSLVIGRMIVDIAQVLISTFVQDPEGLVKDIMCSLAFNSSSNNWTDAAVRGLSLIFLIVAGLAAMIAVLIMSFLLWIRKIVILLLVAAAPLAFVMLAFPPTEQYFKQWWGWFLNWAFMGPIMMLIIWIASLVGGGNCNTFSISALFATCGLLYLSAIVPFKLGGAVMGAWGNLGKKMAKTTGNAAWNNPWAKATRARSGQRGAELLRNNRVTGRLFKSIDNAKAGEALYKGLGEKQAAARLARSEEYIREKQKKRRWGKPSIEAEEQLAENMKSKLKRGMDVRATIFFQTEQGAKVIDDAVTDSIAAGNLEREKQNRMYEVYMARAGELQEYEGSIANTQKKLDKVKDNSRKLYAEDRLEAIGEYSRSISKEQQTALEAAYDAKEKATNSEERQAAEAQLQQAWQAADDNVSARADQMVSQNKINNRTGKVYTKEEAKAYIRSGLVSSLEKTRYFAIKNARAAEDASADSQTYPSSNVTKSIIEIDPVTKAKKLTKVKYGPNEASAEDVARYFRGEEVSSGRAAAAVGDQMEQLKYDVQRQEKRGAAIKEIATILDVGNQKQLNAVLSNTWHSSNPDVQQDILNRARELGITTKENVGEVDTAELRKILTGMELNVMGNARHRGFATTLVTNLQKADGETVEYYDDNGDVQYVIGRNSLGKASFHDPLTSGALKEERNKAVKGVPPRRSQAPQSNQSDPDSADTQNEEDIDTDEGEGL